MRRSFFILIVALIAATLLCVLTNADIRATSLFYQPGVGFPIGKLQPWWFLYRFGEYPAFGMGTVALLLVVAGFFKPTLARFRRPALFVALLLIIAPGILANVVFKDHWGRPRPGDVDIFGGTMAFHQPWLPGPAPKNASFPAGHPTVAFYMSAPYFILREKKRRRQALLWLWGGILYGIVMGVARVIQGGHFVTDVIWSAGFVYLTAMVLASSMRPDVKQ
ncbi:MAG: phosphatase PAP2 family protein [Desulfobacteraceae bacterium]|nr:phosphatase PAP2 family protein [Desulfobacteraceae bacterium]